jgi:hypothetical protein
MKLMMFTILGLLTVEIKAGFFLKNENKMQQLHSKATNNAELYFLFIA